MAAVTAVRKRAQIAKANRTMFIWVVISSILVGFATVGIIFLVQMLMFNERVLNEKNKTVATLKINNDNVGSLQSEIRALDANQALMDARSQSDEKAIQVVLDALPSEANSLALGASLQNKLLTNINIESLSVDPVGGIESSNAGNSSAGSGEITFSFSVSGDEANLKRILSNLEKSIRTIQIISLKIENQGSVRVMTVQAKAFYEPAKVVELKDKTVKQ